MTSFRRLAPLLLAWASGGCAAAPARDAGVDLLVFAPHPDDEVLGCAGILRQAIAAGRRVKLALFTNGDGFPGFASKLARKPAEQLTPADYLELARYRQSQSLEALRALGGNPDDLVFLGYPDSALNQVYLHRGPEPLRQKFTQKTETYGIAKPDFRSIVHGRAAPYTSASVLADVVELIRTTRPARICVTDPADRHPDHQAAFKFVKDGVEAAGYGGPVDTYLIHGGPEWPWPLGITPETPFDAHGVNGSRIPQGVPWPPTRRVALSAEEARFKLAAIRAHSTHLVNATESSLLHEKAYLESFVKSEEVFWAMERR